MCVFVQLCVGMCENVHTPSYFLSEDVSKHSLTHNLLLNTKDTNLANIEVNPSEASLTPMHSTAMSNALFA